MTRRPSRSGLPLLMVPHGYRSAAPLELAAAADGVCELLWLVRAGDPEVEAVGGLLRRLGRVIDIDGMDTNEVVAASAPFPVEGVAAFRDDDLPLMADVAARLGLPFHSADVARRLVDKVEQRTALRAGGVPVPNWWEIPSRRDAEAVAQVAARVSYPAVVKPVRGSGSWHTFPVDDADELIGVLAGLAEQDAADEAMIVEQFIPSDPAACFHPFADYVSVETLAATDGLHHLAVTGRFHPAEPLRETGFFLPSALAPSVERSVLRAASEALSALGVERGCVHTEIKLTPDGPRVIEVNGRMGGGVREMLLAASGTDLLQLHLCSSLRQSVELTGLLPCGRIGFRFFYQPPASARQIRSVGGLGAIGAIPGVESVSLHLQPGDPVDARQGSRSFVFSVVGSAPDHAAVADVHRLMDVLAVVTYEHVSPTTPAMARS